MLQLNIIDSELELVPETLLDDFQIRKIAKTREKRPSEMILDSNYMHGAIDRKFPGSSNRMGRPDIFHHLLNVTQDSILNKRGLLEINIHTKNDLIIHIDRETRIPRSYNRFLGLIEKLFVKGILESPDGKVLMNIDSGKWDNLMKNDYEKVLLSPRGPLCKPSDLINRDKNYCIIMGGFSEGDFSSPVYEKLEAKSVFEEELTIWTVAWEMIASMETVKNLR